MKTLKFIFCSFLFWSCTSNTIYKKPKNLIPKDSMILLLTDMHIAASAKFVKNKNLERDLNYLALIYESYKIDSTRFKTSNIYYTSKFEEYNTMLQEVKKNLQNQRKALNNQLEIRDSIEGIIKEKIELDSIQ